MDSFTEKNAWDIDEPRWMAIRVRSRFEKIAAEALRQKGYEYFLPLYRSTRVWSDRTKRLDLPLFPGYLFCRFSVRNRVPVLESPGVMHIVGIGKTPIPVDDGEIAALQKIVHSGLPLAPCEFLQLGQRVRIRSGPLADVQGILVDVRKRHRIVISISLLRRSVLVELDREAVSSVDSLPERGSLLTRSRAVAFCAIMGMPLLGLLRAMMWTGAGR
jgi:transcription antitermination factor NusG